jgi:hypothetical protein
MKRYIEHWKKRAKDLKRETYALYLAYGDPRVPWYAKVVCACTVGYALSPISNKADSKRGDVRMPSQGRNEDEPEGAEELCSGCDNSYYLAWSDSSFS